MWTNELELTFLEYYQQEPILWDTKNGNYKDRNKVHDAWQRISDVMDKPIEDLKRKKDSLMATYRVHGRKAKASLRSGANSDTMYTPIWFAYEFMKSFLGERNSNICRTRSTMENLPSDEQEYEEDLGVEEENYSNYVASPAPTSSRLPTRRCSKRPQEFQHTKQQMSQDYVILQDARKNDDDECDLYVKLLAKKLRRLPEFEREQLMYEIDELFLKTNKRLQSQLA